MPYAIQPLSIWSYFQCCRKIDRVILIIHGRGVRGIPEWFDLIMDGFLIYEVNYLLFLEILMQLQDYHF